MRVGVLFSGGKDSAYAAYVAKQKGHDLKCLITIIPKNFESYLFHYPNIIWTKIQAKTIGLPIITRFSSENEDDEYGELEKSIINAIKQYRIEGLVSGGISSNFQRIRFKEVCDRHGLSIINPIWMEDSSTYLEKIIKNGFKAMIVSVAAAGLTKEWLGRIITNKMIGELKLLNKKYDVQITFEGGEAETFVIDCPLFSKKIKINSIRKHWLGDRGFLEIKDAELCEKSYRKRKRLNRCIN